MIEGVGGNITCIAAGISGFEVTRAAGRGCGRGFEVLGGDAICVRSSEAAGVADEGVARFDEP